MAAVERIIRRAGWRVVADLVIRRAGTGLAVGAGVGLALLLLDRLIGPDVRIEIYPVLAGAGLLIGVVHALLSRPGAFAMAVRLDRQLGLSDRLGTAQTIRTGRISDDEFAALVRHDAQRVAESIDLKAAAPIRVTGVWAAAAALAAALGLGIMYLPAVAWTTDTDPAKDSEQLDRQRSQIVQAISEAVADLDDEPLDEQSRDELDALDRLAQQLGSEPSSETELAEARDQSAARLDELADRMAEAARRNLQAADSVAERFAGIDTPEAPMSGEEFTEALRQGEFGDAADLLEQLMDSRDEMPPSTRQALAEHLRQMGEQLEQTQDTAGTEETDRGQQLEEALRDLGVDEQTIDDLLSEPHSEEQVEQTLHESGIDEETLRQLARDVQRLHDEQQIQEQADQHTRSVADTLKDAADELEQSDREDAGGQPSDTPDQPSAPAAGDGSKQPAAEDQPPAEQRRVDQRGEGSPEQQRDAPGEQPSVVPSEQPSSDAAQEPHEESDERPVQRPGAVPQQRPEQQPAPDQPATPQPGAPGVRPAQQPVNDRQGQPASRQGDREGQDLPDDRQRRVGDVLRQLERARREALERRATGERLRRAARDLADQLTEEEKRRLVRQWLRNSGGPPGTLPGDLGRKEPRDTPPFGESEDLDLRGDEEPDTVIAQWLSREPGDGEPQRGGRGEALVRRAQTAAEQAVEESAVPSRYHTLIQRYFGRLKETVDRAAPKPTPEGSPPRPALSADSDDGS